MAHVIKLPTVEHIVDKVGLRAGGRVQMLFTQTLHTMADEYTPFDTGVLKNTSRVVDNHSAIEYTTPYAQYQWYGKLMVDPLTLSSWARAGTKKILDPKDRDLKYHRGPLRTSKWVHEAYYDNEQAIIDMLQREVNK